MRIAALALGLVLLPACGSSASSGEGGAAIEVTRADGTEVKLPESIRAWCAPPPSSEGGDNAREVELFVLAGEPPSEEGGNDPATYWIFSRPTKDIARSRKLELPDDEVGEHASFFVYDAAKDNELSSFEEEAKGTVEVEEWGCDKGATVRISVDATLDSEFHDASDAEAKGEVETVIGDPPSIPD